MLKLIFSIDSNDPRYSIHDNNLLVLYCKIPID